MQQDAPALLIDPDTASHAELVRVIGGALHAPSMTIADDAFTRDSMLVIDRRPARDAAGQRLSGRDFGKPEQFQLVTDGQSCALLHLRTGQRHPLAQVRCKQL
jgi:hypothetical protein